MQTPTDPLSADPPWKLGALSGCAWGVIALVLGYPHFGAMTWSGVLLAPFIGMLIGELSHPMGGRSRTERILVALFDLYLAAALFGLAVGFTGLALDQQAALKGPGILLAPVLAVCVGVTVYIWFLWPLAFLNHELLWRG
jgi:hypothetical protein